MLQCDERKSHCPLEVQLGNSDSLAKLALTFFLPFTQMETSPLVAKETLLLLSVNTTEIERDKCACV